MKNASELIQRLATNGRRPGKEEKVNVNAVRTIAAAVGLVEVGETIPPELRREIDQAASDLAVMRAEDVLAVVLAISRGGLSLARPISPVLLKTMHEVEELPAHRRILGKRF